MLEGSAAPEELIPFILALEAKVFKAFREPDQGCFKKPTTSPALVSKMGNTESRFGIGVHESLVALVHAWRYILRLSNLIAIDITSIEDLEDEHAKSE